METVLKDRDSRNIRIFDILIAICVVALSVFVIIQAIKLESLRCEVKVATQIKPRSDPESFYKSEYFYVYLSYTYIYVFLRSTHSCAVLFYRMRNTQTSCVK